jgi:hypothetical protein
MTLWRLKETKGYIEAVDNKHSQLSPIPRNVKRQAVGFENLLRSSQEALWLARVSTCEHEDGSGRPREPEDWCPAPSAAAGMTLIGALGQQEAGRPFSCFPVCWW